VLKDQRLAGKTEPVFDKISRKRAAAL